MFQTHPSTGMSHEQDSSSSQALVGSKMLTVFPFVSPEAVHFTFKEIRYMEEIVLTRSWVSTSSQRISATVSIPIGSRKCPHLNFPLTTQLPVSRDKVKVVL